VGVIGMMWWWGGDHMGAAGWIGMAFMILFWVAVVIGVIYLVRYLVARPGADRWHERPPEWREPGSFGPGQGKPDALRLLEERYARGDIEQEEFQRRKADLTS
jgi:putative membrane protein